jgi:drug/metabolite transporter (DMT)-like permease
MTFEVIILALAASGFTAMASVAQRRAAAPAPGEFSFNLRLVGYLLRRPVWFLGILCMIFGFAFQVAALRVGSLSVVQPVIATELVIVFGVIALHDHRRVHLRDWISAVGMVIGLGAFLALARPHGGRAEASMSMWALAGSVTFALAGILAAVAYLPGRRGQRPGTGRKAALLGIAAAVGFGFVAAVVKELSTHLSQGPTAVFLNWSPYVLLLSGAVAMFLASNAFQAGSLAASQPGLTIVDPLVAGALGVILFGESLRHNPLVLLGEVLAVALVIASVIMLSRSPLVQDEDASECEVAPARPVPLASTGDRVPVVRLPRAVRRPLAILANDKGSAPDSEVSVASERRARRRGARSETGAAARPDGRGERLVNQL